MEQNQAIQKQDLQTNSVKSPASSAVDSFILEELEATMGEAGPAFIADLIVTYLEDTPDLLDNVRQALAQKKASNLERAAHTLKSNSATVGAIRLSTLCQELENMGYRDQLERAAEKLAQVEGEYERVQIALKEICGEC